MAKNKKFSLKKADKWGTEPKKRPEKQDLELEDLDPRSYNTLRRS